jgi:hypothetical protein
VLKDRDFKKIIIMGPDHRVGFSNCSISDASAYKTPLGTIDLHPDSLYLRQKNNDLFIPNRESDAREHCIEVEIPFLQHYLNDFKIIPIVMGPGDIQKYADAIDAVIDKNTLIVVSSDLSHYLPYDQAVKADQETIGRILSLDLPGLSGKHNIACGIVPIQVLTYLAIHYNWKPYLLHYSNSGDTTGPKDRVVGYAAIAYVESPDTNNLKGKNQMDKEKGKLLLKLARQTIAHSLNADTNESNDKKIDLSDKEFSEHRGTFVTLTMDNQLRGCIGNLSSEKSIAEGVKDNAINAAFHDPRFPPLSIRELNNIDIEISLLTEPERLAYHNGEDLLEKLRPGIDGVIIRKGPYSSTFLPQVWDQLPDKQSFLNHLCQKAGLPADEWRRPGLEVLVYQVQYFEEEH